MVPFDSLTPDTLRTALLFGVSGLVISAFWVGYSTGRLAQIKAEHRRFLARERYLKRVRIHHARHLRDARTGTYNGQN